MRAELEKLDAEREQLLARVEGWSPARLTHRPDQGSWSALGVFDHLAKTETEILIAVRRGLGEPHRIGVRDRVGVWFLDAVFRSDRRVKAPGSVPQILPGPTPEMAAVLEQWDCARRALAEVSEAVGPELEGRGIFRHPVGGWMTLSNVVGFFSVHMLHHGFQLERLRRATTGL